MQIPTYQIHNVLNTYSIQLFKAIEAACLSDSTRPPSPGVATETRREAVIDKIAAEIVQRITQLDSLKTQTVVPITPSPIREDEQYSETQHNQFVFQKLDIHNNKTSQSLSIEDSIFLIKKNSHTEPT
jgi:hypothetical protein